MKPGFVEKITRGDVLLGSFHDTVDPQLIETVGLAGFDYVMLEFEHGLRNLETVQHLIRTAETVGLYTIVRIAQDDIQYIERFLDAGADGISVAHVTTAEEVRRIVERAKYPPHGKRGEGVARRDRLWRVDATGREWQLSRNKEIAIFPLIEDPEALDEIEQICAVDGVTGLFLGPGDMALALGEDSLWNPKVQEVLGELRAVALAHGLPLIEFAGPDASRVKTKVDGGARLPLFGHDTMLIGDLYDAIIQEARSNLGIATGPTESTSA